MSYIINSLRVARAYLHSGQPLQVDNSGMSNHKQKIKLIRSEALFHALSVTTLPVKWIVGGALVGVLGAAEALCVARAGTYEGKVRGTRLVAIVGVDHRAANVRDDAFWADRACIRYHDKDVPNSPSPKARRKLLCDIWDRAVQNPPPRWRSRTLVP